MLTKENAAILHIIADIKGMMNTIDRVSLFLFPHLGVALVGGMMCYKLLPASTLQPTLVCNFQASILARVQEG